jgi:hypothetical protein
MIEKDHLAAWDLVVPGTMKPRDYTLQIAGVESKVLKTVGDAKGKRRCVVRFDRAEKAFVANTTNCTVIENMYGADTDGWIGKSITLYQGDVRNPKGSGTIKGIKVRPQVPSGKAEPIKAAPIDTAMRAAQDAAFEREPAGREPGDD